MKKINGKRTVVFLNGDYTATVSETGIEVGCQTFPLEIIDQLKKAVDGIKNKIKFIAPLNKYYGVLINPDKKGFIAAAQYDSKSASDFRVFSICGFTYGNGWSSFEKNTLDETIHQILDSNQNNSVFEFDTAQELFKWLAE